MRNVTTRDNSIHDRSSHGLEWVGFIIRLFHSLAHSLSSGHLSRSTSSSLSLSLSICLERDTKGSSSADNTNLPGLPVLLVLATGTRENGLFSHYAYYVPPSPLRLAPPTPPFTWGIEARRQAGHHHYAGRRESRYYALSLAAPSPSPPLRYGIAVAARAGRLSMQKVEFE